MLNSIPGSHLCPAGRLLASLSLILIFSQASHCLETHVEFDCKSLRPILPTVLIKDPKSCPAYLTVTSSTYSIGQSITVKLNSKYPLISYIIQARSLLTNHTKPHGVWSAEKSSMTCINTADTVLFFSPSYPVRNVELTWTSLSPSDPAQVYFKVSIVAADGNVWLDIYSTIIKKIKLATDIPSTTKMTTKYAPAGVTTSRPSGTVTKSIIQEIEENQLEEKIVEFQQREQRLLEADDVGNEGDWSRTREKDRMDLKFLMKKRILVAEKKKISDRKSQEEILQFELADQEAHAFDQFTDPPAVTPATGGALSGLKASSTTALLLILVTVTHCAVGEWMLIG